MDSKQVQDIRLMYEAVYNEELREKAEEYNNTKDLDEDLQQAVDKGLKAVGQNPVVKAIGNVIAPVGKGRKTPTATSGGYRPVKEDIDLFDYLLEYLVAEGYADTNQDALVIMANLDQDQINDILTERRRGERDEPRRESSPAVQVMKKRKREEEGRPEGQQRRRKGDPIPQPESPVARFERNREYQRGASERAQASSRFD